LDGGIANGNHDSVSILLGNRDGTFQPRKRIPVANSPFALVVGDFNHDGNMDIVTANYTFYTKPGTISVLLGHGDGTFAAPASYPAGRHPYNLARYGPDTIAVIDYDLHMIRMMHGPGDGTFTLVRSYSVPANPFAVVVADFNGDGILDLATSNWGANNVSVLLGTGGGKFAPPANFTCGQEPEYFAVGDFNNDHKPDLAVPLYGANDVSILINNTP
jgi:hypothetical protein